MTTVTLTQEIPEALHQMIEATGGVISGLVDNNRDEFVDVSFKSQPKALMFREMLDKQGYNARDWFYMDYSKSVVRVYA